MAQLGNERLTLAREPEHADALAAFCKHFGLEYRGATLCAVVAAVREKLLCMRRRGTGAQYVTQNFGQERIMRITATCSGTRWPEQRRGSGFCAPRATTPSATRRSEGRVRF